MAKGMLSVGQVCLGTQGRADRREAMKIKVLGCILIASMLLGCARSEDSRFAMQAARRGDDCRAIATGSAMDAYGHGVGPAEEIYETVKRDCRDWYRSEGRQR
jgi:hypothetical protein